MENYEEVFDAEYLEEVVDDRFLPEDLFEESPPPSPVYAQHVAPVATGKGRKKKRSPSKRLKRGGRIDFLTPAEKKQLALEVKNRPVLWELSHRDHYNTGAHDLAWREIGRALGHTVPQCKMAWLSLREGLRYRKRQIQKKSGSEGGEPLPGPSRDQDLEWEFAEDLAFLPETSRKRKTFTTDGGQTSAKAKKKDMVNQENVDHDVEVEDERMQSQNDSLRTNYFYQTRPGDVSKSKEDDSVTNLANNINRLVEFSTSIPVANEEPLEFQTALANIDRMLQKLPSNVVEDALFEMTALVYGKMKETE